MCLDLGFRSWADCLAAGLFPQQSVLLDCFLNSRFCWIVFSTVGPAGLFSRQLVLLTLSVFVTLSPAAVDRASCKVHMLLCTGEISTTLTDICRSGGGDLFAVFVGRSALDELFVGTLRPPAPPPPPPPRVLDKPFVVSVHVKSQYYNLWGREVGGGGGGVEWG